MRHRGCKFECEDERNEQLIKACEEQINKTKFINMQNIFSEVVNMPTKRFWVSEERAAIVVSDIRKRRTISNMRPQKQEMFKEISRRVNEIQNKNPQLTLTEAVTMVVNREAPKFYLTPKSAKIIYYRVKKSWYDLKMQQLRSLL